MIDDGLFDCLCFTTARSQTGRLSRATVRVPGPFGIGSIWPMAG